MSDTLAPPSTGTFHDAPTQPLAAPTEQQATPSGESRQSPRLAHTRGGLPVIPLAVATGNTTIAAVSAAALAGGPLALALLAGGAATATGVAALRARSRRTPASKTSKRTGGQTANRFTGSTGSTSRAPGAGGHRSPTTGAAASGGRGLAGRHQRGTTGTAGSTGSPAGAGSGGRAGAHRTPGTTAGAAGRTSRQGTPGTAGGGAGRAGGSAAGRIPSARSGGVSAAGVRAAQVRAARAERSAAAPSVRDRRTQDTAARRTVGDARRAAKQTAADQRRAAKAQAKQAARSGHQATAGVAPAARSAKEAAKAAKRQAREGQLMARRQAKDGRVDQRVRDRRVAMRKGAVARAARKRLRRSAWRYWARWAGAALLAGAVGVLGTVTTPIGRRLGAPWLMHPGRRLFARMVDNARAERDGRDQAIAAALEADLQAAEDLDRAETGTDTAAAAVADTVPRAPRNHNSTDSNATSSLGEPMTATFSFAAVAAEMEALAHTFEPDGMMAVLQMCEELPEALQSIANVFKILAEKADTEFPLEPAVGEAFNEVYITIQMASLAGGEVGPIFRDVHEQDIRRHEDPRNGEDKWDTTNN
ncbi:hypothetical protein [Kitasatospora sp. NPDC058218]|uniref:hypothetical protein n=1 Tax=Kitasatospora sp. NPDC058218 TaxID=3346385 RepID=UPI0036D9407B